MASGEYGGGRTDRLQAATGGGQRQGMAPVVSGRAAMRGTATAKGGGSWSSAGGAGRFRRQSGAGFGGGGGPCGGRRQVERRPGGCRRQERQPAVGPRQGGGARALEAQSSLILKPKVPSVEVVLL
ncbi:glycine-rich RNA-binding protein 8-like [Dendrobium catenatum]|uniref:glycine-rich RNA-binding protein 8-like n=1 Tax=Dendrobium catenatum TaxID=906689 RepID=UPI0010A0427D|nr:glycine-rich RNA-binding protein 8-like [Dendrobium catenatum]